MTNEKLYTIGQMAEICGISAEQLRHYDKHHILSPNGRGRENNYRLYTEAQIDDILLIKELKSVGLPLKSIAALLKDKQLGEIKAVLEENMLIQRRELHEQQKRYDRLVDALARLNDAILTISQPAGQSFTIVPIAERPIISTRCADDYSVNAPYVSRYTELYNLAEREGIETSRSIYLLYHEHYAKQFATTDTTGDLEIFMNITGSVRNGAHCRMFGGFLAACATHVGHYRYTSDLYGRLAAWACEQGHRVSGISFQELIVGRTTTGHEENYVTKIYLPLNIDAV